MSEPLPPSERAERHGVRRHSRRDGARGGHAVDGIQALHRWVSVLPATVMALLGSATVAFLLAEEPSTGETRVVLAIAIGAALVVMFASAYGAGSATRWVYQRVGALQALNTRGQADLRSLVDKVARGERPSPPVPEPRNPEPRGPEPQAATDSDPFAFLGRDLRQGQHAAQSAVLQVANLTPGGEPDLRVEVFVNLARRMQSLVHREIQLLDDLEAQVEDPDLLKGLFTVDHLATRMRRQSESLAVLGGAASRRQWSRPVGMQEVLRAAIAEVEHYSRVKVVPPIEGTLHGNAVADIIHLVAELVENATKFSAPHTQVLLRAEHVTAGLAIEVDDRGLGMPLADQRRINGLLADPGRINISELLYDGRIGLFVVSALARRHGIKVALQTNIYGGIQAVVVLPAGLVDAPPQSESRGSEPRQHTTPAHPETTPARIAPAAPAPAAAGPRPVPARLSAGASVPASRRGEDSGRGPAQGVSYPMGDGSTTGGRLTELPVRKPSPRPVTQDADAAPAPRAAPAPATELPARHREHPAEPGERPPLPQRRVQAHLAPELRDAPARRHEDPGAEHTPGLMAAFQGGVHRADEEDGPAGGADDTP